MQIAAISGGFYVYSFVARRLSLDPILFFVPVLTATAHRLFQIYYSEKSPHSCHGTYKVPLISMRTSPM